MRLAQGPPHAYAPTHKEAPAAEAADATGGGNRGKSALEFFVVVEANDVFGRCGTRGGVCSLGRRVMSITRAHAFLARGRPLGC